jgi:catechol 2,3-dioxygenase-like lactoylglutathione lyase family enzyme
MKKMHIHIAVSDIDESIRFYSAMFGAEPGTHKKDYAKWDLDDPVVNFAISSRSDATGLDHIGIQTDSDATLTTIRDRLDADDITGKAENNAACCYAKSDKYWTMDPQGIAWETFHTLASIPTFNERNAASSTQSCCTGEMNSSCC